MKISSKIEHINTKDIYLLNSKDIEALINSYKYSFFPTYLFKINGEIYHVKSNNLVYLVNELIGQYVTDFFGGKTLSSNLYVDQNDLFYLITENFIKKSHNYTNLHSRIFPNVEFDEKEILSISNLDSFNYIKKNNTDIIVETHLKDLENLKRDLKMMLVNDFIRKQSDRKFRNFMFEYKNNRVKLMPLYDFEYSFDLYKLNKPNSFNFDLNDESVVNYVRSDDTFQELFYKAMDLDLKTILERLQDEYPVRMNSLEISKYMSVVLERQDDIKKYKLLK